MKYVSNRNMNDVEHYYLYSKIPWGRKVEGHSETSKAPWKVLGSSCTELSPEEVAAVIYRYSPPGKDRFPQKLPG